MIGDDARDVGWIAFGPPMTDDEVERIDLEGYELFPSEDASTSMIGALFIRVARLERERRHA
jgi:hypothetical protein